MLKNLVFTTFIALGSAVALDLSYQYDSLHIEEGRTLAGSNGLHTVSIASSYDLVDVGIDYLRTDKIKHHHYIFNLGVSTELNDQWSTWFSFNQSYVREEGVSDYFLEATLGIAYTQALSSGLQVDISAEFLNNASENQENYLSTEFALTQRISDKNYLQLFVQNGANLGYFEESHRGLDHLAVGLGYIYEWSESLSINLSWAHVDSINADLVEHPGDIELSKGNRVSINFSKTF